MKPVKLVHLPHSPQWTENRVLSTLLLRPRLIKDCEIILAPSDRDIVRETKTIKTKI